MMNVDQSVMIDAAIQRLVEAVYDLTGTVAQVNKTLEKLSKPLLKPKIVGSGGHVREP